MSRQVLFYPPYEGNQPSAPLCPLVKPLENLPTAAFKMIDFDAYEMMEGTRKLVYATSVGCPYACNYCTDTARSAENLILNYPLLNQLVLTRRSPRKDTLRSFTALVLSKSARWRIRNNWYSRLAHFGERLVMRRSLINGQDLPMEAINAC